MNYISSLQKYLESESFKTSEIDLFLRMISDYQRLKIIFKQMLEKKHKIKLKKQP